MDLLNLDALVEVQRCVTLRGKQYEVAERSVGVMLDAVAMARSAAAKNPDQDDMESFLTDMVKTIRTILPTCPEEVVRSMSLPQMSALITFANTDPQDLAARAAAAGQPNEQGVIESAEKVAGGPGEA